MNILRHAEWDGVFGKLIGSDFSGRRQQIERTHVMEVVALKVHLPLITSYTCIHPSREGARELAIALDIAE